MGDLLKTIFIFILTLGLSCATPQKNKLPTAFNSFTGKWKLENSNTYEIWEQTGKHLNGHVIKVTNNDTLIVEHLRIFKNDTNIYYEATVPSQNNRQPIRFKLTEQQKDKFQFENPNHDFPQKIVYIFENKNELKAIISGGDKQATFTYQKIF